jgi:RND superfamily putative drug exporter
VSLAARVAAATSGLLAVSVVVVSVLSLVALTTSLDARDRDLLERAVARVSRLDPADVADAVDAGTWEASPTLLDAALLTVDGELVGDNLPRDARVRATFDGATAADLAEPTVVESTVPGSGFLAQAITLDAPYPVTTASGTAEVTTIVLAVSREDRDTTLRDHRQQLVRTAPWVAVLGGVAALVLARAALRPLRRIADQARRFGAGERGRLRPQPSRPARTEVDQVAAALDEAFDGRWRTEDRMRDFIADAGHELRTPLAAVHGWADLYQELAREGRLAPADEVIGHVLRETDRMTHLVDEMLALARLEWEGLRERAPVDLVRLVADLVTETAALHPSHDVRPIARGLEVVVETDAVTLGRAVRNLLVNAVTHTPPGTTVRAGVRTLPGATVRVEVADSGPGLDAAQLARAEERFWRAEDGRQRPGGSGLGLAIVSESARSLGGRLVLGRAQEGGLSAAIELPQGILSDPGANAHPPGVPPGAGDGLLKPMTTQPSKPRRGLGPLGGLGARCASHPLTVIAAWVALLVGTYAASAAAGGAYDDSIDLPGSQVTEAADLIAEAGGSAGSSQVVLHVEEGTLADASPEISGALASLAQVDGVAAVSDPFDPQSPTVSEDGTIGYTTVSLSDQPRALGGPLAEGVTTALDPLEDAGVEVAYASVLGQVIEDWERGHFPTSEIVGLAVAVVVLLVAFAGIAAALLPILTAVVAVLLGLGVLGLMTAVLTFGSTSPVLATMIGIGVGVDYALFLLTRYRQDLMDGVDPITAAARTAATSGHSVLVAGGTVAVALLGLYASGVPFIGSLGLATVFTVATAVLGALTLVPAAMGLLGRGIDRFSLGTPKAEPRGESGVWFRHARWVSRRPWLVTASSAAVLLVLTVPLLDIRLGHVYEGAAQQGSTTRVAFDLLADGFGPGINAPMTVVVDTSAVDAAGSAATVQALDVALADVDGLARATPLQPVSETVYTSSLIPTTAPDDEATDQLFQSLRDDVLPAAVTGTGAETFVTGSVPGFIEFSERVTERLLLVIALVVVVAFFLLVATFRSIAVAIKAAVLNLISIGASYGVIVAVFQWGWGSSLLGLDQPVPIEAFVPMMMFAVVFGLSMDYEVFLVSRIRESWVGSGNTTRAVGEGLAATARVITAAALIMMSVFLSFVTQPDIAIKMLSIGLTVSVLLDATLVRLLLVPASMTLMGRYNWWIPGWLDRVLPHVEPAPLPPLECDDSTGPPATPRPLVPR